MLFIRPLYALRWVAQRPDNPALGAARDLIKELVGRGWESERSAGLLRRK